MGKLSPPVVIIADRKTQPEGIAVQQLHTTVNLPHIRAAAGMPDLHAGRGYPVGAAFFSVGHFYPALIGSDIGCGMALWQTDLRPHKMPPAKLARRIGNLDDPLDEDGQQRALTRLDGRADFLSAIGTIGGGNHFAEIQQTDAVLSAAHLPAHYDPNAYQLLVHSGSRGLGGDILRRHIAACGHAGLPEDSTAAREYLCRHQHAIDFSRCNRQAIAARIARHLGADLTPISDCCHNALTAATFDGIRGWLHRKGAAPADEGLVVIAGSRGSYSYLVRPTQAQRGNLASLAHGAERKWQRGACKARLSANYRPQDLVRNRYGGHIICADKTLLYDEAPQAYRNIENTIATLVDAGLIIPVARLKPLLTYKTRGSTSC